MPCLDRRRGQRRPIRPVEALERYRTGSRCSRVGPEVMRMRAMAWTVAEFVRRRKCRAKASECARIPLHAGSQSPFQPVSNRSIAAWICSGSAMRPGPLVRQLSQPSSGPTISTPSPRSNSTFRCTAGCCHIRSFIAGANNTRPLNARYSVLKQIAGQSVRRLGHEIGRRREPRKAIRPPPDRCAAPADAGRRRTSAAAPAGR